MASVSVRQEDGLQVEGVLGEKLRIRPLPEEERSEEGHVAHLIFEVDDAPQQQYDYVLHESGVQPSERQILSPHSGPLKRIYPELYIMMDSQYVENFTKGLNSIVFYFGIMINAVNLRYLGVKDPAVRNRIVGFELLTASEEKKVIYNASAGGNLILGRASLAMLRDYVKKHNHRYKQYDMLFLVTGLDIVEQHQNGTMQYAGFAYIGAVCTDARVGIGEDIPKTWFGVRVIAHEVAHLLGCPHDGDSAPGVLGRAPGSRHCPWADGYLMSYIMANLNQFQFSPCCKAMIRYLTRLPGRECMTRIDVNSTYNKQVFLPGKYVSGDKQCRVFFPSVQETHNIPGDHIKYCTLRCFVPKRYYGYETYLEQMAFDGTSCSSDPSKVCYNGFCKDHPKIRAE